MGLCVWSYDAKKRNFYINQITLEIASFSVASFSAMAISLSEAYNVDFVISKIDWVV